jgi:hypothetical protein
VKSWMKSKHTTDLMILPMQWEQKTVSNGGMGWGERLHGQNPIVHQALLKEHKVVEHSTLFPRSHDAKSACSRSSGSILQMIEIFRTLSKAIQITMTSVLDQKNEPEYLEFVCQ